MYPAYFVCTVKCRKVTFLSVLNLRPLLHSKACSLLFSTFSVWSNETWGELDRTPPWPQLYVVPSSAARASRYKKKKNQHFLRMHLLWRNKILKDFYFLQTKIFQTEIAEALRERICPYKCFFGNIMVRGQWMVRELQYCFSTINSFSHTSTMHVRNFLSPWMSYILHCTLSPSILFPRSFPLSV